MEGDRGGDGTVLMRDGCWVGISDNGFFRLPK
jgi:hypothetical protein